MPNKTREPQPLKHFDYKLVSAPLDGLLFNVDRDLEKKDRWPFAGDDCEKERQFSLLLVLLRFTKNSYNAVRYLTADHPSDVSRKASYTLVIPPVNRQLLDLLFSIVYMLEDIGPRSLAYQKSGWRELVEERHTTSTTYAKDPKFRDFFEDMNKQIRRMVILFGISEEEQKDCTLVQYWPTPSSLVHVPGSSRPFRRHLAKWIYRDVSSKAHLGFGGLQKMAGFLLSDLMPSSPESDSLRERAMQSFHFEQVSRAAILTLAVATEIDTFCELQNQDKADYLWIMFGEYVFEAQEMWEKRYKLRPRYAPR